MHLFAVLGDPVRFRIVEILASGAQLSGEVIDAVEHDLGISRSAVSHHLRILREEGIVEVQPDETQRIYRLRWNALDRVDRILLDLYEKWDHRVGWPYQTDPLSPAPRRHRLAERKPGHPPQHLVEPNAPAEYEEYDEESDDGTG